MLAEVTYDEALAHPKRSPDDNDTCPPVTCHLSPVACHMSQPNPWNEHQTSIGRKRLNDKAEPIFGADTPCNRTKDGARVGLSVSCELRGCRAAVASRQLRESRTGQQREREVNERPVQSPRSDRSSDRRLCAIAAERIVSAPAPCRGRPGPGSRSASSVLRHVRSGSYASVLDPVAPERGAR